MTRKFEIKLGSVDFIRVHVTNGNGALVSSLNDHNGKGGRLYSAIDALESLVLAHGCAGVDIEAPEYVEGIESALEKIMNEYS